MKENNTNNIPNTQPNTNTNTNNTNTKKFNPLKEFTTTTKWWLNPHTLIWGGGHTVATDPTNQGWKARHAGKDPNVVLVGRPDVLGCFSARHVPASTLGHKAYIDLAYYDDTPKDVAQAWKNNVPMDAIYHKIDPIPGWGLEAIKITEDYRRQFAVYDGLPD